jgi:hypothetical protein
VLMYSRLNTKLPDQNLRDYQGRGGDWEGVHHRRHPLPNRHEPTLMIQYIEFVADRLVVQLLEKIFNSANPSTSWNSSASSPRRTSSRNACPQRQNHRRQHLRHERGVLTPIRL